MLTGRKKGDAFSNAIYYALARYYKVKKRAPSKRLIEKLVKQSLVIVSGKIFDSIKENKKTLRHNRTLQNQFEKRHYKRWKVPIDLLEILLSIHSEMGSEFNNEFRPKAAASRDVKFEALTQIHARSCIIGEEILILLKSGFSEGAMARWRSLYELSLISNFIASHDNELANMYLQHSLVKTYNEALKYQRYIKQGKLNSSEQKQFDHVKQLYDSLIQKYDVLYKLDYGWANKILPRNELNIYGIAKYLKMEKLLPYYVMSCNYIHGGSKSITFRLCLPKDTNSLKTKAILPAGPSTFGLADPGQLTAICVSQILCALITSVKPVRHERVIGLRVVQLFVKEIEKSFCDIQHQQEVNCNIGFATY